MKTKRILSILILLLSVFMLVGCDLGSLLKSQTRTYPTKEVQTTTKSDVTTAEVTTTESIITTNPIVTTAKPVVTTSPIVTTDSITTSVTIWHNTTTAPEINQVWTTPLTDALSLSNIETYYSNFDYSCIDTLEGVNLIKYIQTFLLKMPGMASQTYGTLRSTLLDSDRSLTDSSKIILFYSRDEIPAKWDQGKTWNREHVFCKSLGGFDYEKDAVGHDIHHVRPTDSVVNSTRNNSPYGVVANHNDSTAVYARYSENQSLAGWSYGDVFEPIDSVKGDVARICFYVSVCYYMKCGNIELKNVVSDKTLATILAWNKLDPVDEYEAQRNNVGYEIQGNRNIFIDYPDLADVIWG